MTINFYKYQGAGNDFILLDNRDLKYTLNTQQINFLCDRRFGIGADGLMLLETANNYDFKMVYYNADGNESTMCGNGGRCIASFAFHLKIANQFQQFIAIDGVHNANILENNIVSLQMVDVQSIEIMNTASVLNTGSPHYVEFVSDVDVIDVFNEGKKIRNLSAFQPKGINVNFAEIQDDVIKVRTYERGVEDETLACGTGVTAVALAASCGKIGNINFKLKAYGGDLEVSFDKIDEQTFKNIWLKGPAQLVFEGSISI